MLGDCDEGVYIEAPFYSNFGGHRCRVMRKINEHDEKYYYKDKEIKREELESFCRSVPGQLRKRIGRENSLDIT